MNSAVDQYAHLNSPIHRWEHSAKMVALLGLIFAFAWIKNLRSIPFMIGVTTTLFLLSHLPFSFLLQRLRYPGWFLAALVIAIPFTVGDTILWQWGWVMVRQEGCLTTLLIVTRFLCILTVSIVLFSTAPFLKSIRVMRSLGLPDVLVDMTLLSYRYLESIQKSFKTLQISMRLRGFNPHHFNHRTLKTLVRVMGSLLIRSYEKSQRVYQAMILRGYGSQLPPSKELRWQAMKQVLIPKDSLSQIASWLSWSVSIGLMVGEFQVF